MFHAGAVISLCDCRLDEAVISIFQNIDDVAADHFFGRRRSSLSRSIVLRIAGFDQLCRCIDCIVGVVEFRAICDRRGQALRVLVDDGRIRAVGYGGC